MTFDVAVIGKKNAQIPGRNEIESVYSLQFHCNADPFDIVVYLKESNGTSVVNVIKGQIQNITGVEHAIPATMVDISIE